MSSQKQEQKNTELVVKKGQVLHVLPLARLEEIDFTSDMREGARVVFDIDNDGIRVFPLDHTPGKDGRFGQHFRDVDRLYVISKDGKSREVYKIDNSNQDENSELPSFFLNSIEYFGEIEKMKAENSQSSNLELQKE